MGFGPTPRRNEAPDARSGRAGECGYTLRAEGIRKCFGRTEVLTSAGVWARSGEVTTLLGRNGSGKTTLLRIACGDLRADQGTVWIDGTVEPRPRLHLLARRGLMYLPQDRVVVPGLTVAQHFGALRASFGEGLDHLGEGSRVAEAVERAQVGPLMDQRAASLSGGERMRVCLALALARRPRILVADEPLVGLAPRDQEAFGGLLRELAAGGTAVLTSGHDAPVLLRISDAVIWSVAGGTHHLGHPDEARRHPQFRREYLGPGFPT